MQHDDKLPGLTLTLVSAELKARHGFIHLSASVNDVDTWNEVVSRLNGMRIYTVNGLAEEMVNVAQRRARLAEEKAQQKETQLQAEVEQLRQQLSFTTAESARLSVEVDDLKFKASEYDRLCGALGVTTTPG